VIIFWTSTGQVGDTRGASERGLQGPLCSTGAVSGRGGPAAGFDCSSRVGAFITKEDEAERYAAVLQPGSYRSITVGRLGIGRQRDFSLDHYGAGACWIGLAPPPPPDMC
jgi:hypothetical protein